MTDSGRLPVWNLDILRAIAVLLVVIDHSITQAIPKNDITFALGRSGVLIFFVHTSAVLMASLSRQQEELGKPRMAGIFYLRRFMRIYPLAWAVILFVLWAHIPSTGELGVSPTSISEAHSRLTVVANLLLMQNLMGVEKPILMVLWTLPIELQMYMFLPFLYTVAVQSARGVFSLWVLSMVAALSFAGIPLPGIWRVGELVRFAPCFIPGVLAFALVRKGFNRKFEAFYWPVTLLLLLALFILSGVADKTLAAGIFCLLLGLAVPRFKDVGRNRFTEGARWLAERSYGLYLFHVPAIIIAFKWVEGPILLNWVVYLALLALIPSLTLYFVEKPFMKLGRNPRMYLRLGILHTKRVLMPWQEGHSQPEL